MKRVVTILGIALTLNSGLLAGEDPYYTYTYGVGTDFQVKTLSNSESILVNGGGGNQLTLFDWTYARIESTSHLVHPYHSGNGIPELITGGYSTLVVTGGEIGELYAGSWGKATISGGSIGYLYGQLPSPPAVPANKYIQFLCKSWNYDSGTKKLAGLWGDDTGFNIQLVDTSPWPSGFTYDSINFTIVPEPMTLLTLGLGGMAMRRVRKV
jgi:hypothetical protein